MPEDNAPQGAANDGGDTTVDVTVEEPAKTFTQDQVNDLVARTKGDVQRRYGDYQDLKEKASKFDELSESQQSDLERLTGERDRLKQTAEDTVSENLRLRVAVQKNLPADLIDRLRGDTQEELEADADKLLELVKPPPPDFEGGARTAAPADVEPGLGRLMHAYENK